MEKLNMQTTDVVDENIKRIGELFPNCFARLKPSKSALVQKSKPARNTSCISKL